MAEQYLVSALVTKTTYCTVCELVILELKSVSGYGHRQIVYSSRRGGMKSVTQP